MEVVVKIRYGDFWVGDLPSSAVDAHTLSQIHGAMMLAALRHEMGIEIVTNSDELQGSFPVVSAEWGRNVSYQDVIIIPMGDYYIETGSNPKITKSVLTGSRRGVSFPVSTIPNRRAYQKMYGSSQAQGQRRPQRRSVWDIVTRAIEHAFGDRVLIHEEKNGETSVTVTDRKNGRTIVWYKYVGEKKLDQGGTCLSGSEQILSPFAVVAAYYQILESGRNVADGVAFLYP